MSEILLTGLRAGTPIGFLAALGLFRHASEMTDEFGDVRLCWVQRGGEWCANLLMERHVNGEAFLSAFVKRVCSIRSRPELEWSDQIKKNTPEQFRSEILSNSSCAEWFAAFGSELALSNDGTIRSTAFDMTGGQQKFLFKLREASLALSVSEISAKALLNEALFGPWLYSLSKASDAENSHSMGLDPATLLQGAFTCTEPAGIKDKRGVRGAIWLAFEAMPFFPCAVVDGRLQTAGFFRKEQGGKWRTDFEWGVWKEALTSSAVKILLLQSRDEWTLARGIAERFRSERVNLNKDYYSLATAELGPQA